MIRPGSCSKLTTTNSHFRDCAGIGVPANPNPEGGLSGHRCKPSAVPLGVHQLLATDVALDKLGRRGISAAEAEQLLRNSNTTIRNPRAKSAGDKRALLIGRTDGGRALTLVIERTVDPTSWLIVTGWSSTRNERRMLKR